MYTIGKSQSARVQPGQSYKHTVWQGVDFDVLRRIVRDALEAGKRVLTIDVHSARAANTFTAGSSQSQGGVDFVLDLDESVEDHRTAGAEINLILLHVWLLAWLIGVPAVDRERLHLGWLGLGRAIPKVSVADPEIPRSRQHFTLTEPGPSS